MKIGILGNTNNYPFVFAMLLQELGQEVIVVISEKELLHRPRVGTRNSKNSIHPGSLIFLT
jgi:hypothetical protein